MARSRNRALLSPSGMVRDPAVSAAHADLIAYAIVDGLAARWIWFMMYSELSVDPRDEQTAPGADRQQTP